MPNQKGGYPKPSTRKMPLEKIAQRMTRADSLSSYASYGRIVPLEDQAKMKKKKPSGFRNPFEVLANAIGGKR